MNALSKTGERQVGVSLEEIREDHRARYQWALARLDPSDSVLDAGCGVGYGSNMLARHVARVHAVDASAESVAFARRHWEHPQLTFHVADLCFAALPELPSFDAVVCFEVIEHLLAPRLFLTKARELMKPQGRIFISVPNEKVIPHTVELNPFHLQHYTHTEACRLLQDCGFEVLGSYSQDTQAVQEGTAGRFLILEARVDAAATPRLDARTLANQAVLDASGHIVSRAAALAKAKRDVNSLKLRLEEAVKNAAARPNAEESAALAETSKRLSSLEQDLIADLREQRSRLETRCESLQDQLLAVKVDNALAGGRIEAAERESAHLRQLAADETRRAAELERAAAALQQHIAELETTGTALHKRITELDAALGEREDKLKAMAREVDEKGAAAMSKLREDAERSRQRLTRAESAAARSLALAQDNDQLRRANETLAQELSAQQRRLEASVAELDKRRGPAAAGTYGQRPSVGLLLRTLKTQRLFFPYLAEAVRNTYRSKVVRRRARR